MMNVAGPLARAISDGVLDADSIASCLNEMVQTLPALAGAAGEPDDAMGGFTFADISHGASVDDVAGYLSAEPFPEIARPVPLSDFVVSGRAGVPKFSRAEVEVLLSEVSERDPGYVRSWLEFAPIPSEEDAWVAYPQNTSLSLEFQLILPVIQNADETRLLSLDTGLDVKTGRSVHAALIDPAAGCDPGVVGVGWGLKEKCLRRTCQGDCRDNWKLVRGEMRLVGCVC
jgi:hypothetical protein